MKSISALIVILAAAAASPAQIPSRLIAPPGTLPGSQLVSGQIATWAAQIANETSVLQNAINRLAMLGPNKPMLMNLAAQATRQTAEVQRAAFANASIERILREHREADASLTRLINAIQQSGVTDRQLSQIISRVQYADEQLELALTAGSTGNDVWRGRALRIASALDNQAGELRALADETLTNYDRALDRAIRRFATGCAGVELNLQAGETLEKIQADVTELGRRWQTVATGLATSVSANAAVRAQASRVAALLARLTEIVRLTPGLPGGPDIGFLSRGSAFAISAGTGGGPRVKLFPDITGGEPIDFFAYSPEMRSGVRVALADLTGDRIPDIITAPGPGGPPLVRVFDGRTLELIVEFLAYDAKWNNGVFVAAADVTRNGVAMVVTGADAGGGPHVRVFDLAAGKVLDNFFPYPERFGGGVRVALGDVNGDGIPDVVTAPGPIPAALPGQPPGIEVGPLVKVFDGRNRAVITEFNAYDARWRNGVWVSTADVVRNGRAEILTGADSGGGPHVRVFDGLRGRPLGELYPFPLQFNGGVRVAAHDVNNDGVLDFICAPGPSESLRSPPVRIFDGRTKRMISEFVPFEGSFRGGAFVGAK